MADNEGLFRVTGMWGEARDGQTGQLLAEVTEVTATAEVNRIEVPLVGTMRQGYKPGRITREGTFRVQKIDSKWEMKVYSFISTSIEERRRVRGTSESYLTPFDLIVGYDDPEALGKEKWRLKGCLLWRLPLGFNIGDDIRDLEFPFSYETEIPINTYEILPGDPDPATGLPRVRNWTNPNEPSGA